MHGAGLFCDYVHSLVFYYREVLLFFFNQKTAYVLRISVWRSDVCSSDLSFAKRPGARQDGLAAGLRTGRLLPGIQQHPDAATVACRRGAASRAVGPVGARRAARPES